MGELRNTQSRMPVSRGSPRPPFLRGTAFFGKGNGAVAGMLSPPGGGACCPIATCPNIKYLCVYVYTIYIYTHIYIYESHVSGLNGVQLVCGFRHHFDNLRVKQQRKREADHRALCV